ncbi:hypothetical protein L9F63_012983, partial [Diploptera punctata]
GDTPAIFRLSRCLYSMKCCIIYRINNFVLRHPASTNFTEDIATVHTIIPIHATHVPETAME